jgi:hypothetical protein
MNRLIKYFQVTTILKIISPVLIGAALAIAMPPRASARVDRNYISQNPSSNDSNISDPTDTADPDESVTAETEATVTDESSEDDADKMETSATDEPSEADADASDTPNTDEEPDEKPPTDKIAYTDLTGRWTTEDDDGILLTFEFFEDQSLKITYDEPDGSSYSPPRMKYKLPVEAEQNSVVPIDIILNEKQAIETLFKLDKDTLKIILIDQDPGKKRPAPSSWQDASESIRVFTKKKP